MRRISLILLVLMIAGAQVALAKSALVGNYDLFLSDDASWHRNLITIDSGNDQRVKGMITIDWSLGPEGRAPNPDERAWNVPFEARLNKSGGLEFQVTIGKVTPTKYEFELYPVQGDKMAFAGVCTVTRSSDDVAVAGPWRHGVLARAR